MCMNILLTYMMLNFLTSTRCGTSLHTYTLTIYTRLLTLKLVAILPTYCNDVISWSMKVSEILFGTVMK